MSSRFICCLCLVVVASATQNSQAAEEDVSGMWKVAMSFQGRQGRVLVLQLEQEGDRLSGSVMRSEDSRSPIENGLFRERKISFDLAYKRSGRRMTTNYTGQIEGDSIRGKAEYTRRGETRVIDWVGTRTTLDDLKKENARAPVAADIDLNAGNYAVWRDHILPQSDELAWAKIPWLTTFQDGILEAGKANKPLLLWTMNGHPLGCT